MPEARQLKKDISRRAQVKTPNCAGEQEAQRLESSNTQPNTNNYKTATKKCESRAGEQEAQRLASSNTQRATTINQVDIQTKVRAQKEKEPPLPVKPPPFHWALQTNVKEKMEEKSESESAGKKGARYR